MKLIDDIRSMFGIGESLDEDYEPGEGEEEGYGLEEGAEGAEGEGADEEEDESIVQKVISFVKENKVAVIAGAAIILALILLVLGFSLHKTKVDAVLSDQEQGELIDAISDQLSTLEGQVVTKEEADEIASAVVEDSFPELLTTTMKGYSQEEIIDIVRPTIEEYLRNNDIELTEEEINEVTKVVSKNIQAENDKLRKELTKLQTDIKNLQENAKKAQKETTPSTSAKDYGNEIKNLNSAVASNKTAIAANKSSIATLNNDIDAVEADVKDLKKKIKTENVSTTLIEYVFKGDNSTWVADNKTHKSGSLSTAEFCKALAGNDAELKKAINELKSLLDKRMSDVSKEISEVKTRIVTDEARLDATEAKAKAAEDALNGCSIVIRNGVLYIVTPDGQMHRIDGGGSGESETTNSRYTDPVTGFIYVINKKNGKALIFDVDIDGDYEIEDDTFPAYVYMPNDYTRSNPIPVDPDSELQDDPDKWYKGYIKGRSLSARYLHAPDDEEYSTRRRNYEDYLGGDSYRDGYRYGYRNDYRDDYYDDYRYDYRDDYRDSYRDSYRGGYRDDYRDSYRGDYDDWRWESPQERYEDESYGIGEGWPGEESYYGSDEPEETAPVNETQPVEEAPVEEKQEEAAPEPIITPIEDSTPSIFLPYVKEPEDEEAVSDNNS